MMVRGVEEDKEEEGSASESKSESEMEDTVVAEGGIRRGLKPVVRHTGGGSPEASSKRLE